MRILLVFPRIEHGVTTHKEKGSWGQIIFGYPSITLPMLAALTPERHSVEILNENYRKIDYDADVDLVGITTFTMTAPRAYEIADEFRKHGKTVVLGGYHVSALPEEAKPHADSLVLSEAEKTWPKLLRDFEKGQLKQVYPPEGFDPSIIPPIRRDLIRPMPIAGGIQSSRGCPNQCEFCAITSFYNHGWKRRPIEKVIEEMRKMPNRLFIMHDPSMTINLEYSKKLFKAMIDNGINKGWMANANINVLGKADDEFLKLAREAGCVGWFVGYESVSQRALKAIKKTGNKVRNFKKNTERVRDFGLAIQGGIIFGFDQDTPEIFDATVEALKKWNVDAAEINILTPFPGTPLYDRLEREDRILTKDWTRYNQVDVVFQPKHMSPEELFAGARRVAKELYSFPELIKRMYGTFKISKRPLTLFMHGANLSYRRYYKRDYGF